MRYNDVGGTIDSAAESGKWIHRDFFSLATCGATIPDSVLRRIRQQTHNDVRGAPLRTRFICQHAKVSPNPSCPSPIFRKYGAHSNVPAGEVMSYLRLADANVISMDLQLDRSALLWRPELVLR